MFLALIDNSKPGNIDFQSPYNQARWNEYCKLNKGKEIRLDRPKPVRTLTQNAFYWAWLHKVELETGNFAEDMHIYGKTKFLPKRLIKVKGKKGEYTIETVGSTSKLSKLEFGEYMDKFADHVGIPLPTVEEIKIMGYVK